MSCPGWSQRPGVMERMVPSGVLIDHALQHGFGERAVVGLAFAQGFFHVLAFGEIQDGVGESGVSGARDSQVTGSGQQPTIAALRIPGGPVPGRRGRRYRRASS